MTANSSSEQNKGDEAWECKPTTQPCIAGDGRIGNGCTDNVIVSSMNDKEDEHQESGSKPSHNPQPSTSGDRLNGKERFEKATVASVKDKEDVHRASDSKLWCITLPSENNLAVNESMDDVIVAIRGWYG